MPGLKAKCAGCATVFEVAEASLALAPIPDERPAEARQALSARTTLVVAIAVALALAAIAWLVHRQAQPVGVRVSANGIAIDTPFYGTTLKAAEIEAISLEPALPRIEARTNGFSGAGALRGHFRLAGMGDGRLYVEAGRPPYLLVRTRQGFAFVGLPEPERTRALYEEAARLWPERTRGGQ